MNAGLLIIILLLGLALLGFPIYIALGIGALALSALRRRSADTKRKES